MTFGFARRNEMNIAIGVPARGGFGKLVRTQITGVSLVF